MTDRPFSSVRLRRGLAVPLAGAPEQVIHDGPAIRSVGLVASDWNMEATCLVRPGERVQGGQPVLRDRRHTDVSIAAPGTGVVAAVHAGAGRGVESIVVALDGDDGEQPLPAIPRAELATAAPNRIREALLASGCWASLRTRPYGRVPAPDAVPAALFVTAIDTEPLCPDPRVVIADDPQAFEDGLTALSRLTAAPIFLCCGPAAELPTGDPERVRVAVFDGPHPAGLPGTHIHLLSPVGATRTVWQVGYQDVVAIGRTLTTGRPSPERIVALAGPVVRRPRLVRTRAGASLDDLLAGGDLHAQPCRVISGSVLSGRTAAGVTGYLGPRHRQVTVVPEEHHPDALAGSPAGRPWSLYALWRWPARPSVLTTARRGRPQPMLPLDTFDAVMPLDVLATPLLRALLVGDVEAAEALGCLELEEEDLALCTTVCPSKNEYGPLLRAVLREIERRG